jgi:hypothetical protein
MNTIVTAIVAGSLGWPATPVSAPYGFVEIGQTAVIAADGSTIEIGAFAPYAPYALSCQRTVETVAVPAAGGSRQITVNRC